MASFTYVPAQGLIVELLENVFLYCLQQDVHARMERDCAPLNVSQVCRHWRRVSLEISRLWARLHIILDDDESVLRKIVPVTRLCIRRSRTSKLSIHVESLGNVGRSKGPGDPSQGSMSWNIMKPVFTELAKHSHRLKDLTLTISEDCCPKSLRFIDAEFPELEELTIRTYGSRFHFGSSGFLFDQLVPKLKTLHYEPWYDTYLLPNNLHPSKSLKKLIFAARPDHVTLFHNMFNVYRSLKELHVKPTSQQLGLVGYWDIQVRRVRTFSSIRTLELTVLRSFEDSICEFLGYTRFSNLLSLTLRFSDDVEEKLGILQHLVDLVKASKTPIEEFNLINSRGNGEEEAVCVSILGSLKGLKSLHIGASNAVMGHLGLSVSPRNHSETDGSPLSCPLLEDISIDVRNVAAESYEVAAVRDMISSRVLDHHSDASSGPSESRNLKKVSLLCDWEEQKIWTNIVREFRDRGLAAVVYS